jgi:large subunit ribosomal protein L19
VPNTLLTHVESKHLRASPLSFQVGDLVDVHCRIVEGEKERIQIFSGTVIARRGTGLNATFTVRRIVNNEGVERIFPLHSPKIEKLEVKRQSKVRRAKLYYLRERTGKATRLKEGDPIVPADAPAAQEIPVSLATTATPKATLPVEPPAPVGPETSTNSATAATSQVTLPTEAPADTGT